MHYQSICLHKNTDLCPDNSTFLRYFCPSLLTNTNDQYDLHLQDYSTAFNVANSLFYDYVAYP